ncbi:MAG: AbiU2 domain-containing protein [Bdellovibrionota bacterium]
MAKQLTEERLREWSKYVLDEVMQLRINDHVFWEVQEIIKANAALQNGGTFLDWIAETYLSNATVRLRKLTDRTKNVRSFVRLLEAVKADEEVRSRQRYLAHYKGDDKYILAMANEWFDKWTAKTGSPVISKELIQKDIDALTKGVEKVNEYTNLHVTHARPDLAANPSYKAPTYTELTAAIGIAERLTIKYRNMFFAESRDDLLPTWQYDWKKVFYIPWAEPKPRKSNLGGWKIVEAKKK